MTFENQLSETVHYGRLVLPSLQIPSENTLYHPTCKGGRAWLYKDAYVSEYQEAIHHKMILAGLSKLDKLNYKFLTLKLVFFLSKSFKTRDTTNMVKSTEDAIVKATGIDDSKHFQVSSEKMPSPNSKEYVLVVIKGYKDIEANEQNVQSVGLEEVK